MVPNLRKKRIAAAVVAVSSCNFRFPSLHLVCGLSFNDSPGHEGFQRLYLCSDSALHVRVLSPSTSRRALIQIPSVPNIIEANHPVSTAASFGREH